MSAKHIRILVNALETVIERTEKDPDENHFICCVIQEKQVGFESDREDILAWISRQLRVYNTACLNNWLRAEMKNHGVIKYRDVNEVRIRWLQWMIDNHTIFEENNQEDNYDDH